MEDLTSEGIGKTLRAMRRHRKEPLRVVAAAIDIDSTLLSKIERGERLPTGTQVSNLARYFDVSVEELEAQVIAERIVAEYGSEAATLRALSIVRERMSKYGEETSE